MFEFGIPKYDTLGCTYYIWPAFVISFTRRRLRYLTHIHLHTEFILHTSQNDSPTKEFARNVHKGPNYKDL